MTHYVVPNTVLALPGFAAGVDWSDTLLLLGIAAFMFVALGAFAMIMLARQLPFLSTTRQTAVAPPPPPPPPPPRPVSPAPAVSPDRVLAAQRSSLIQGCVKARGLLDDDMVVEVLENALRLGGVTTFDATGAPLDPRSHRVNHTVPAPAPQSDGIVARTLTPGYLDGGHVLRPADVVVYKWAPR